MTSNDEQKWERDVPNSASPRVSATSHVCLFEPAVSSNLLSLSPFGKWVSSHKLGGSGRGTHTERPFLVGEMKQAFTWLLRFWFESSSPIPSNS